jgi:hypothetical protein
LVGLVLAWVGNVYLAPILFNVHMNRKQGAGVVLMFTVLSLIRQYVLRRVFNAWDKKP